jgi:hypothetical protein
MTDTLKTVMRPPESEQGLRDFCKEVREIIGDSPTIVELGSYNGESSLIFSQEFPNGKIYCIDIWKGGFDDFDSCSNADYNDVEKQFDLRLKLTNNIEKIVGESTSRNIECDLVYIDACHKYECVKNDILHWLHLTKKIISGHDYCLDSEFLRIHPHIKGVKVAIDEMLGTPDRVFKDMSWFKIIK